MDIPLPIDILTDKGVQRITLNKKGVILKSTVVPQIDPDTYYIKKVIIE
jgi:hypothetical protein